jgi:hypothetical protein
MKKLKSLFIAIIIMVASAFTLNAQVFNFTAYEYNYQYTGYNWNGWVNCNVPISVNLNNSTIRIYNALNQSFTCTNIEYNGYDSDGDYKLTLRCVDNNYINCRIRIIDRSDVSQFYVDYSDVTYVYNLKD